MAKLILNQFDADCRKVRKQIGALRQRLKEKIASRIVGLECERHGWRWKITSVRLNSECHIEVLGVRVNAAGREGKREMYIGFLSLCEFG